MAKEGHRDDIPGLAGGGVWCVNDNDYCGGEHGECECCGGDQTQERERSVADEAREQSGVPVAGGTQVSPSAGPPRMDMDVEGHPVIAPEDEGDDSPDDDA